MTVARPSAHAPLPELPAHVEDVEGAADLGRTLTEAGYTVRGMLDTLNVEVAGTRDPAAVEYYLRRLPPGQRISTLMKLFWLARAVDPEEAAAALAPLTIERLTAMGILGERDDGVWVRMEIVPRLDFVIASDWHLEDVAPDEAEHVLGMTAPSTLLASLTVRPELETALDLGTGSGLQALLLSRHVKRVVGVDINPRALFYAELNAALNGITNVEFRQGDLFEPVEGSAFDLVVSNPPYVVSPDTQFVFRDSSLPGDSFCEAIVQKVPEFLEEGGIAQLLAQWVLRGEEDWSVPLRRWVEGTGCDAILMHYATQEPLSYAAEWNHPRRVATEEYAAAIDRWNDYYREEGIDAIGWGSILLRRRSGGPNWVWAHHYAGSEDVTGKGRHLLRLVEAQDFLAAHDDESLLARRVALVDDHCLDHMIRFRSGGKTEEEARLRLETGFRFRAGIDPVAAQILPLLDGSRPLGAVLEEAARNGPDDLSPEEFVSGALGVVRGLVELGFLVPAKE